ncbi:MAG: pilus assembly protein [Lachnospiraceae bacterium]|nr:pilus assembly protein [Lachnospiraceae bacterium]
MKTTIIKINKKGTLVSKQGLHLIRERAFFSAWKERASLTLETAVVLPIFMFFIIAILNFLVILSLQSEIQLTMEETARSIGKKAYLVDCAEDLISSNPSDVDSDTESLLSAGINSLTIKTWMMKDGLKERLDRSQIIDGAAGLYTYNSSYDEESGILDLVVTYNYQIPFLPKSIGTVALAQRCYSHVWIGKKLDQSDGGKQERESHTVYVTPYGKVYHTSKDCRYLDLSIRQISVSTLSSERNADGKIYEKCTCANHVVAGDMVYVTDYGTNWHTDINCYGLKRTVNEIDISEIGSLHVCPKCGENH